MNTENTFYALHIGVDHYAHPDISDLPGANADVDRWVRYCKNHLQGREGENVVRLCGSDATREAVENAVRTLGQHIGANGTGLITFSGHGAAMADTEDGALCSTAALCPYNARPNDTSTFLTVANLEEWLGKDAAPNVTAVLDACYSRSEDGGRCINKGNPKAAHAHSQLRVLQAAAPWQQASEIESDGEWKGAFTFALVTLLEQWRMNQDEKGRPWAKVSYGDLVFRTQELLALFGLNQQPVLRGAPRLSTMPFLQHGAILAQQNTVSLPDAPRNQRQLGFGSGQGYRIYQLGAQVGGVNIALATIVVSSSNATSGPHGGVTVVPKTEYWFPQAISDANKALLQGGSTVDFKLKYASRLNDWATLPTPWGPTSFQALCDAPYTAQGQPSGSWLGPRFTANGQAGLCVRMSGNTMSAVAFNSSSDTTSLMKDEQWYNKTWTFGSQATILPKWLIQS